MLDSMKNTSKSPREIFAERTSLPVIVAPMFLVSTPELVIASCREGFVGSIPAAGNWNTAGFEKWLHEIKAGLDDLKAQGLSPAPYSVNLGVRKPGPRLDADIAVCEKFEVPIIHASGEVSKEIAGRIHSYGGIILQDVTTAEEARRAVANGVDGVIATTQGAGGQGSTSNPLGLINEIRQFYDGFVVLAGCVSTGQDIVTALSMGADAVNMGTRFICTKESAAEQGYKDMIVRSTADDIIYTSAPSGQPANFMKESILKEGFDAAKLKKEGAGAERIVPPPGEASKAWIKIWSAGQGAGSVNDIPTMAVLANRLKQEYQAAKTKLAAKFGFTTPANNNRKIDPPAFGG